MNRRKSIALILSILLHIVALSLLWLFLHKAEQKIATASSAKRVDISLSDFITPPPATSTAEKGTPPAKGSPDPKPLTQNPKPKTLNQKPKTIKKPETKPAAKPKRETKPVRKMEDAPKRAVETRKTEQKEVQKIKPAPSKAIEETKPKKEVAEKTAQKEKIEKENLQRPAKTPSPLSRLAESLGAPSMPAETPKPPTIDEIGSALSNREFKALYKDEFDRFTPEQKRFIKDNLSRIQGITQHYLTVRGYPYAAARLGQDGMNIVEFYLHPNGDISGLKVIEGAGFEELDKNSLDTIKTAYKDYPRPKETTKIRFYIYYRLY